MAMTAEETRRRNAESMRRQYWANPEKIRERNRRWKAKNLEKHRAYCRRWYWANREYALERNRQWCAEHR